MAEEPLVTGRDRGALDHVVPGQVRRRGGAGACREIGGGTHQYAARCTDTTGHQASVRQVPDAHGDVYAFVHQVEHTVGQDELPHDRGVARQERAHDRRHAHPAEHQRRGDHEAAGGLESRGLRGALGFVHVLEDARGALEVARTGVRQADPAGGALQQANAQPLFERRDEARGGRGGDAQLARGGGEAVQLGHGDEGAHRVQAVHSIIAALAMVKCQWR